MRGLIGLAMVAAVVALGGAVAAATQDDAINQRIDQVLGDHIAYERVILATQKAIAAHDAAAVAALVRYPIKVQIKGHPKTITNPTAFIAEYDQIVTPAIASVVSRQAYADLFVRDQGVMFGSGEVWIGADCLDRACTAKDVKIITIQPTVR